MRTLRLLPILFLLFFLPKPTMAQVVTAGVWTGYPDGIGILEMTMRDSFIYYNTANGTAFFNTASRQHTFFRDMGNPSLPSYIYIDHSTVDKQGNLWTILEDKLTRIAPNGSMQVVAPKPDFPVNVLRIDQNGLLWAGLNTYNTSPESPLALAKFTGSSWEYVSMGQHSFNVQDLAFDQQNHPVVSAWGDPNGGIFRYEGGVFTPISGSQAFSHLTVSSDGRIAACGSSGSTYLGYYHNGVWMVLYGGGPWGGFAFTLFDANNTLWAYHETGEIFKLVNENDNSVQLALSDAKNYRTVPTIEYGKYNSFGFDPGGQLWLGKSDAGLFVAADPAVDQWEFVPTAPLLNPGGTNSITARGDTAWIGTNAGVTRLLDQSFEKLTNIDQRATALWYDTIRQGLWVGSPGMVGFYQGNTQMLFDIKPLLPYATSDNKIPKIVGDSKGNIWVQTYQTLLRYDPAGNWFSFDCGQELPTISITNVQVQDSVVWVSVYVDNIHQSRLFKLEGNVAIPSGFPADLLQTTDFNVLSDTEGWFVDFNYGTVTHYRNGQTTQYTQSDIGGYHNYDQIYVYNDSTVFLFSIYGLYVYKNGHWYFPEIPSDRIFNYGAKPWCVAANNKLYLGGYWPLLVIEDVQAFLDQLDDSPTVSPGPEMGA